MDKLRIGVIGLAFGKQHVRTLANMEETQLVAVADRNPKASGVLKSVAAKYGAKAYLSAIEMMEQEALDAVSICTSPKPRAQLIEFAARKSIPMIIEKPWATNLPHAQQLAKICRDHNAMVMLAFSFRFHPAIVKLRELIDAELGEGWMLNGEYVFDWLLPADAWLWDPENGNGFFNENSCHLFDAVCYLLGDPVSAMAEAISPIDRPSEQAAAVTMRFAGGAIASLTLGGIGSGAFHSYPRIDVVTANGQAHLTGRNHVWEALSWTTRGSDAVQTADLSPENRGSTRFTHGMSHFFECIRQKQQPSCGIEDGLRTVALSMAVYESARTGKKVDVRW
jgi:predicted dehydrogenase